METFTKQPGETIHYVFDFSEALNTGDTVANIAPTITIELLSGSGDTPTLGIPTLNTVAGAVKQPVAGGTTGQVCLLTCRVTTTAGEVLENEFRLKIKETR